MAAQQTLLVISQVYVPDPAAVGQYMADAAAELASRGFRVVTLTARRGYDDPRRRYPKREQLKGVDVVRLPLSSFGKESMIARLLGATAFLLQVVFRALLMRRLDGLIVSTSPPMCSLAALIISLLRRVPIAYWVMDVNPDQAVALDKFRANSLAVRLFDQLNRIVLRRAGLVVVLDRFMADRLRRKETRAEVTVIPPWPLEDVHEAIDHESNSFRRQYGLDGKFVFMYSGNMSIAHPLDTILDAALRLRDRKDVEFLFIGGGLGARGVQEFIERHRVFNVRLLPYQPLDRIRYSLSAADVHLVSMGDEMVGIVHPSKIYGAMACARPSLLVGPSDSHVGELIRRHQIGWQVDHGGVDAAVATINQILQTPQSRLDEIGLRARTLIDAEFGRAALAGKFCDLIAELVQPANRRGVA